MLAQLLRRLRRPQELRQRPPWGKTPQGQVSHWPIQNLSKGQRNSGEIGCCIFGDTEAKGPFV